MRINFQVLFEKYWDEISCLVFDEQEIKRKKKVIKRTSSDTERESVAAEIDRLSNEKAMLVKEIMSDLREIYCVSNGAVTDTMLKRFFEDKNSVEASFASFVSTPDPRNVLKRIFE